MSVCQAIKIVIELLRNMYMAGNHICQRRSGNVWLRITVDLEETVNMFISGLRDANRVPEAVKCAEDIIDCRIKLNSSTLSKLKQTLTRAGKGPVYDELIKNWKTGSLGDLISTPH